MTPRTCALHKGGGVGYGVRAAVVSLVWRRGAVPEEPDGQPVHSLSQGCTQPPLTADPFPSRVPRGHILSSQCSPFQGPLFVTHAVCFVTECVCAGALSPPPPKPMAQGVWGPFTLLVREGDAIGAHMSVIRLQDRRSGVPAQPIEWTFQKQVETALYSAPSGCPQRGDQSD